MLNTENLQTVWSQQSTQRGEQEQIPVHSAAWNPSTLLQGAEQKVALRDWDSPHPSVPKAEPPELWVCNLPPWHGYGSRKGWGTCVLSPLSVTPPDTALTSPGLPQSAASPLSMDTVYKSTCPHGNDPKLPVQLFPQPDQNQRQGHHLHMATGQAGSAWASGSCPCLWALRNRMSFKGLFQSKPLQDARCWFR